MIKYSRELEKELRKCCAKVCPEGKAEKDGAVWVFETADGLGGIVSLEDNSEDIKIPTVTILLSLGDASGQTKSELLNLLRKNGDFLNASLTIMKDRRSCCLFLQNRVKAESFKAEKFRAYIDNLATQAAMFMWEDWLRNKKRLRLWSRL